MSDRISNKLPTSGSAIGFVILIIADLSVIINHRFPVTFRVVVGIVLIAMVGYVVQMFRSGILLNETGVVVRNTLRTYRFPWTDIQVVSVSQGNNVTGLMVCCWLPP